MTWQAQLTAINSDPLHPSFEITFSDDNANWFTRTYFAVVSDDSILGIARDELTRLNTEINLTLQLGDRLDPPTPPEEEVHIPTEKEVAAAEFDSKVIALRQAQTAFALGLVDQSIVDTAKKAAQDSMQSDSITRLPVR